MAPQQPLVGPALGPQIIVTVPPDLTMNPSATLVDVEVALRELFALRDRLQAIIEAPIIVAEQQKSFHDAADGPTPTDEGAPIDAYPRWRQPNGAHDAYPLDSVRQHDGQLWRSTRPNNVWEPGTVDSGWVLAVDPPDPAPDPVAPLWVEGESFTVGNLRTYNGIVYRCRQSHTAWLGAGFTPPTTPALWEIYL